MPDKSITSHESPPVMTIPLIVLAVLAVVGGWVGLPDGWLWGDAFARFLAPVGRAISHAAVRRQPSRCSIGRRDRGVAFIGIALAYMLLSQRPGLPD